MDAVQIKWTSIVLLASILLIITGCSNSTNSSNSSYYDNFCDSIPVESEYYVVDSVVDTEKATSEISNSNGISTGYISRYNPINENEQRAIKTVNLMYEYIMKRQYSKAVGCMYDDFFVYIHSQIPEMSIYEIKVEMAKSMMSMYSGVDGMINSLNASDYYFVVHNIKELIRENEKIILLCENYLQLIGQDEAYYCNTIDPILVISLDSGYTWAIMVFSEDARNILNIKFSDAAVNKVMMSYVPYPY